jgi:ABC-2 type transport system permease protein
MIHPGVSEATVPATRARTRRAAHLLDELRVAHMVWRREMLHFTRDRTRAVVSLLQPLFFLFVLGIGIARLFGQYGHDAEADYLMFLFPGVLIMAAQVPAIAAGASIVWDRQSGFLREMLVAPVRRSTLLIGKCLGGATVATFQGSVVLASVGLIGIPYRLDLFVLLVAELWLTALAITVLGAMLAVSISRPQTFNTALSVLVTLLVFLSGLMFPISAMPTWMAVVSLANPLTYALDAMRRTVGASLGDRHASPLAEPVNWAGWHPPVVLEMALVLGFTLVALTIATRRFGRTDA